MTGFLLDALGLDRVDREDDEAEDAETDGEGDADLLPRLEPLLGVDAFLCADEAERETGEEEDE